MSATIIKHGAFDKKLSAGQDGSNGNEPPTMPPVDYVTHAEFSEFRHETKERFARIDGRLDHTATKADLHEARVEMHAMKSELIKWIVGTAIGLGVAAITVMTFVLNNAAPKLPAASPAPIVIQLPAPPAAQITPPK
jgi:hypothetical protein